ncbi:MAG: dipeptide ABC transporter ATP-binding protein [Calditrichaeota bacterium]|nr:dipeptide ABC transporter ATP-binding protein [Calditrichota bacterium]
MTSASASSLLPVVEVGGLRKHFPIRKGFMRRLAGAVKAVDDVSFDLYRGETLGLVGESGCGKTTTGRMLLRLIEPTAGSIRFHGKDVLSLKGESLLAVRRKVQIVFQDPYSSLNPRLTIGSMLGEILRVHRIVPRPQIEARVDQILESVGLAPEYAGRYPHEFSGGQRQRIGIARALAVEPEVIVLDEPVSALDVSIQAQILNLLRDLQRRLGLTYLFVAHDLSVVEHIADRIAVMYLGRIVEIGPAGQITQAPRHPYTRALIASAPVYDPTARRDREPLSGDLPSPASPPPGCHFHPRCPVARPECRTWQYELSSRPDGRSVACLLPDDAG